MHLLNFYWKEVYVDEVMLQTTNTTEIDIPQAASFHLPWPLSSNKKKNLACVGQLRVSSIEMIFNSREVD